MVTMDDQTYAILRDNIYKGDDAAASVKKAQIENTYDEQKYNNLKSSLSTYATQTANQNQTTTPASNTTTTATPSNTQTTDTVKQDTVIKQEETPVNTVSEIPQQGKLKPQSQEYYNQTSDEALKIIKDNLNNYKQTNPEYFTNYEDFKKNFSYNYRNQEQKDVLDNFYKGYEKGLELSSTPVNDLYTQYKDGQISLNDLELLKTNNPVKYTELQNQINKASVLAAYDDTTPTEKTSIQDMAYNYMAKLFNQFMSGDYTSEASKYFEDYKNNMNNPEMVELQDKTTELQEQAKNIQDDIYSMQKEVEKEYEGTGATRSKINAIIADRTYDLQQQLRTVNNEYEKYATQYNNRANQYQNEFQLQLQEYQINMQARNQQMSELGFAMDLMSYETPQQKQEREWNYWVMQQEYANGDINSSNPTIQLKGIQNSVDELLANYAGIPTQRSNVQIAQDIQTAIKNGSNIGAELTKLNQQMQSKPEYKLMYNATYRGKQSLGTINGQSAVISYDANGNYTGYKLLSTEPDSVENTTRTGQIESFKDVWDVSSDWDSYYNNLSNAIKLGSWGGQCGAGANDILTGAGAKGVFGNSLDDKLKVCDTRIYSSADVSKVKPGTFAVFDLHHKSSDGINHGHVGLVTSVDVANNTVTVLDSNGQAGKECWGESTYRLDYVLGTYTPDIGANLNYQGGGVNSEGNFVMNTNTNLNSAELAYKEGILSAVRSGNYTPSGYEGWMKTASEQGWIDELNDASLKGFKVYLNDNQTKAKNTADSSFRGNEVVKEFEGAINQIEQLQTALNDTSGVGDMSAIFTFMKTLDPNSVVREGEFNSAASTAGVANPKSIYQRIIKKNWDGTFLTEQQREDFKKIAKEFVKTKAKNYQIKYDELKRMYSNAGIDEQWLPTNMAEMILSQRDGTNAQPINTSSNNIKKSEAWYSNINTSNTQNNNSGFITIGNRQYQSNFYSSN